MAVSHVDRNAKETLHRPSMATMTDILLVGVGDATPKLLLP